MQLDVETRNARLAALETFIGPSPTLEIRTGSKPANCAASTTGTLLAALTLPSDWLLDPDDGLIAKSGTWQTLSAIGAGDAGYFRIFSSGGACRIQGTCAAAAGEGVDMVLDNVNIAVGQQVVVNSFAVRDGNS